MCFSTVLLVHQDTLENQTNKDGKWPSGTSNIFIDPPIGSTVEDQNLVFMEHESFQTSFKEVHRILGVFIMDHPFQKETTLRDNFV